MLITALKQIFTLQFWQELVQHVLLIFTFGFWKELFQFLFSFHFLFTLFVFLLVTLQTPESTSSSNWLTKKIADSERLGTFLTTRRLVFLTSLVSILLFTGSIFYEPRLAPTSASANKGPGITYQQPKSSRPVGLWDRRADQEQIDAQLTSERKDLKNSEKGD